MKSRILMLALVVALMAAAVGGGTMAWFTAKAAAPEAEFTAGTVMIEAGSSVIRSQYFDPAQAVFAYGVETITGDIYEIDVKNGTESLIFKNPNTFTSAYPNGLAFDSANGRLYFAANISELYFYDFGTDSLVKAGNFVHGSGTSINPRHVYSGTFGGGYYWYIPNNYARLYRISFNNDGTIDSHAYRSISQLSGSSFGDIVIDYRDNIIYGSRSSGFFTYDITNYTFTNYPGAAATHLQLAWGSDNILYGHSGHPGGNRNWYAVGLNGTADLLFTGSKSFVDLASGHTSYWNPGDCARAKFNVENTGSKNIRVRVDVMGEWEFNWEWLWENWNALCFSKLGFEELTAAYADGVGYPDITGHAQWDAFTAYVQALEDPVDLKLCDSSKDDWVLDGGYFYYIGDDPLATNETVELCFMVCLSGPGATNEFQGGRYILSATFYAVQSSHNAPYYEWGTGLYGVPAP